MYVNSKWDNMLQKDTVDERWASFEKRILEARNKFIPQHKLDSTHTQKKLMLMNADARVIVNIKKQSCKKYWKTRSVSD